MKTENSAILLFRFDYHSFYLASGQKVQKRRMRHSIVLKR